MEEEAASLGQEKSWIVWVSAHGAPWTSFQFLLFPF